MKNIYFLTILLISYLCSPTRASDKLFSSNLDSLVNNYQLLRDSSSVQDSVSISDSLTVRDSSLISDSSNIANDDLDAVVFSSSSDSMFFNVNSKMMYLFGKGTIKYKQTDLSSGQVDVNFVTSELSARGWKDTTANKDSGLTDTPILSEDGEVYEGKRLTYNFKTRRGFIAMALNKKEGSRYGGEKVKKVDRNTFFIKNGIYTTCKSDPPHTHFEAKEMKVIQKDKIIAKWIFMYIEGVPLPIPIPFAVFPNETGRRSGIIVPTFGQTARLGSYFRNFGYFFALSDYYDLMLAGDYYTRGGFGVKSRIRYSKRYNYTGNITASYSKQTIGEPSDPNKIRRIDWQLSMNHNQQLDPTMRLNINLQFQSGSYLQNNTTSYKDVLATDIISNATLSKRWDKSGNSLTINYARRQKLENGDIFEELPNVTFSVPAFFPFQNSNSKNTSKTRNWYESISLNYSGKFKNRRNKVGGKLDVRGGFQHDIGINSATKIGYFNISPRANYSEKWYNKYKIQQNFILEDIDSTGTTIIRDSLASHDAYAIKAVRSFNVGLSAQTKLYGMFNINALGIEAMRHTIEPRITYSYRPDFSSDKWGYYSSYKTSDGKEIRYDKFGSEIFSGASSGESQMLNFSLSNIFEIKTIKDPTDTTSQQKKVRILNVDANMSYNFAADTLRMSDLNISYRTQVSDLLNISARTGYTFYDYDDKKRINKFLISEGKGLFRLNNLSLSLSTTLSSDKIKKYLSSDGDIKESKKIAGEESNSRLSGEKINDLVFEEKEPDISIPWSMSFNYNYSMTKPTAIQSSVKSNISANFNINITKNWKISTSGSYDFQRKEFSAPTINIFRNMECWEMSFNWNPIGVYRGFRFEIRMTAPELRDIKVTRSEGLYTGRR